MNENELVKQIKENEVSTEFLEYGEARKRIEPPRASPVKSGLHA